MLEKVQSWGLKEAKPLFVVGCVEFVIQALQLLKQTASEANSF
jgi:hypothetical protein